MAYNEGDVIVLKATFKNAAGTNVDPNVVTLRVRPPGGELAIYTYGQDVQPTKTDTGVYSFDLELILPGIWKYRWLSTGVGAASQRGEVTALAQDI